jgi:hypothetical protein
MNKTPNTVPRGTSKLYWNEQGAIGCDRHSPYPKSDTWNSERWRVMTKDERAAFQQELGVVARCECCPQKAAA